MGICQTKRQPNLTASTFSHEDCTIKQDQNIYRVQRLTRVGRTTVIFVSLDNKMILLSNSLNQLKIFISNKILSKFTLEDQISTVCASPDNQLIAVGIGSNTLTRLVIYNRLYKFNQSKTGLHCRTLIHHTDEIILLKFVDKYLISSSYDQSLVVWNSYTGQIKQKIQRSHCVISFDFSNRVFALIEKNKLYFYDLTTKVDLWVSRLDSYNYKVKISHDQIICKTEIFDRGVTFNLKGELLPQSQASSQCSIDPRLLQNPQKNLKLNNNMLLSISNHQFNRYQFDSFLLIWRLRGTRKNLL